MPCSVAILLQYQLVKAAAAAAQCSVAQMQCWMLCLYWLQPHLKRFSCKQNGRRVNAALSSASGSVYPRRMRHQKTKQKKASGLKHTSTSLRRQHYCAYAYAASLRSFTGVVLIVSAHKRSAARRQRATHTASTRAFLAYWKRVAARRITAPQTCAAPPGTTARQTCRYLAGTSVRPSTRPRSTTFGRRITRKLSWPNGQGVALLRAKIAGSSPAGSPFNLKSYGKKKTQKKRMRGAPFVF